MTTATISGQIPKALIQRFEREAAEQKLQDRSAAIEELQQARAEQAVKLPPLTQAVRDAEASFLKVQAEAEKAIQEANAALLEARGARQRVDHPLCSKINRLEMQLTCELRHPVITDALEQIDRIRAEHRYPTEPVPAKESKSTSDWCQSARERLVALQFVDTDIEAAVQTIMSARP